ncbi:MAG: carboxypeptidase-like regulatory domain-containing protein [Candidatus Riflebacteria bacterium]|nr:carboxypeptidase-like regulatory domain-containing protein [Candidatus Riflebacteria bacterium]
MHKKLFKIIFIITHTWVLFNLLGCTEKVLPLKKGAVSGRVYDENNLSVSGAYITSHRSMLKAETDNYGRFSFTSLDVGSHNFTVERDGYYLGSATATIVSGESVENFDIKVEAYEKMIEHNVSLREMTRAVIDVKCFEPMSLVVAYSENFGQRIQEKPTEFAFSHRIELKNLYSGSEYAYFITGTTKDGRSFIASDGLFRTIASGDISGAPDAPIVVKAQQGQEGPLISWSYVGAEPLKGFRLYRATDDSALVLYKDESEIFGNESFATDLSAIPGKIYRYAVSSVDLDGNSSVLSEPAKIVPGGILTENITWRVSQSPIHVDGDIVIPERLSLVIEPGVTVTFSDKDNKKGGYNNLLCEMLVEGCLYAEGTADLPIRLVSAASLPTRKDWAGIRIVNSENSINSVLKNVVISGAEFGIELYEMGATLENVSSRYCDVGLKLNKVDSVVVSGFYAEVCNVGFYAVNTKSSALNNYEALKCSKAAQLASNRDFTLSRFDVRRIYNLGIEVVDIESTLVENGIIQSEETGLEIGSPSGVYRNLTVDALSGVVVSAVNAPVIKNNIIVNLIKFGRGYGIEDKSLGHSYPYNNIYGFAQAAFNCDQSGATIQNVNPLFVGGSSNNFDYSLKPESQLLYSADDGSELGAYGGE